MIRNRCTDGYTTCIVDRSTRCFRSVSKTGGVQKHKRKRYRKNHRREAQKRGKRGEGSKACGLNFRGPLNFRGEGQLRAATELIVETQSGLVTDVFWRPWTLSQISVEEVYTGTYVIYSSRSCH